MLEKSSRLSLPLVQPAQAQKHLTVNEAFRLLDGAVQLSVLAFDVATPPSGAALGATYATTALPQGDWAGHPNEIALRSDDGWQFVKPSVGWLAWDQSTDRLRSFDGQSWTPLQSEQFEQLGINTSADDNNRLSVASNGSLFTDDGDDHRLTINKASDENTASIVFKSNWTGHAEIGLAGDTAFSFKTSPDGQNWATMIAADSATQTVKITSGSGDGMIVSPTTITADLPITGAAVQNGAIDTTDGTLMRVNGVEGTFGWGAHQAPECTDLDDITLPSGSYRTLDAAAGTKPSGSNGFGILTIERYGDQIVKQVLHDIESNLQFTRIYRNDASGWRSWNKLFGQNSVIGTASSAYGLPSGALLEQGGNANGQYIKFASGLMMCFSEIDLEYINTSKIGLSWDYPVAFSDAPTFSGSINISSFNANATPSLAEIGGVHAGTISSNSCFVQLHRITGLTNFAPEDHAKVHVTAIGMW